MPLLFETKCNGMQKIMTVVKSCCAVDMPCKCAKLLLMADDNSGHLCLVARPFPVMLPFHCTFVWCEGTWKKCQVHPSFDHVLSLSWHAWLLLDKVVHLFLFVTPLQRRVLIKITYITDWNVLAWNMIGGTFMKLYGMDCDWSYYCICKRSVWYQQISVSWPTFC